MRLVENEDDPLAKYLERRPVNIARDRQGEPWLRGIHLTVCLGYANPTEVIRYYVEPEDRICGQSPEKAGRSRTYVNESVM